MFFFFAAPLANFHDNGNDNEVADVRPCRGDGGAIGAGVGVDGCCLFLLVDILLFLLTVGNGRDDNLTAVRSILLFRCC